MGTNQTNSKNPPQTNNEKKRLKKWCLGENVSFPSGASLAFFSGTKNTGTIL